MKDSKLREMLKQRKITIRKCSEDTGISYRTLVRYLNGENGRMDNFRALSEYLDISLDELLADRKITARD